jgi:hypothetical protein
MMSAGSATEMPPFPINMTSRKLHFCKDLFDRHGTIARFGAIAATISEGEITFLPYGWSVFEQILFAAGLAR